MLIPPYVQQAVGALNDYSPAISEEGIRILAQTKHPSAKEALIAALDHDIRHTRIYTALALGEMGDERAIPCLLEALATDEEHSIHERAVILLQKIGEPAVAALCTLFHHSNSLLRRTAISFVSNFKRDEVVDALFDVSTHTDGLTRGRAAEALAKIGGDKVVSRLIDTLQNGTYTARAVAADALGRLKEMSAEKLLLRYLNDNTKVDHIVPNGDYSGLSYPFMGNVAELALQNILGDLYQSILNSWRRQQQTSTLME